MGSNSNDSPSLASLHRALECLQPVDTNSIPQDDLSTLLKETFSKVELIVNSVPPPPGGLPFLSSKLSRNDINGARCAAELTSSLARPARARSEHEELWGTWGKPIKLSSKDNVLGLPMYKLPGNDRSGSWYAFRTIQEGLGFSKWRSALMREFDQSMGFESNETGALRGLYTKKLIERKRIPDVGLFEVYQTTSKSSLPGAPREFTSLHLVTDSSYVSYQKTGKNDKVKESCNPPRYHLVVSVPVFQAGNEGQRSNLPARGRYQCIEMIREIPVTGLGRSTNECKVKPVERTSCAVENGPGGTIRQSTSSGPGLNVSASTATSVSSGSGGNNGNVVYLSGIKRAASVSCFGANEQQLHGGGGGGTGYPVEQVVDRASPMFGDTNLHWSRSFAGCENDYEFFRDPERNPVEWIVITRCDSSGNLSKFMSDRNFPNQVASDAVRFLNWACSLPNTPLGIVPQNCYDSKGNLVRSRVDSLETESPTLRQQAGNGENNEKDISGMLHKNCVNGSNMGTNGNVVGLTSGGGNGVTGGGVSVGMVHSLHEITEDQKQQIGGGGSFTGVGVMGTGGGGGGGGECFDDGGSISPPGISSSDSSMDSTYWQQMPAQQANIQQAYDPRMGIGPGASQRDLSYVGSPDVSANMALRKRSRHGTNSSTTELNWLETREKERMKRESGFVGDRVSLISEVAAGMDFQKKTEQMTDRQCRILQKAILKNEKKLIKQQERLEEQIIRKRKKQEREMRKRGSVQVNANGWSDQLAYGGGAGTVAGGSYTTTTATSANLSHISTPTPSNAPTGYVMIDGNCDSWRLAYEQVVQENDLLRVQLSNLQHEYSMLLNMVNGSNGTAVTTTAAPSSIVRTDGAGGVMGIPDLRDISQQQLPQHLSHPSWWNLNPSAAVALAQHQSLPIGKPLTVPPVAPPPLSITPDFLSEHAFWKEKLGENGPVYSSY